MKLKNKKLFTQQELESKKLLKLAALPVSSLLDQLESSMHGLTIETVEERQERDGKNIIDHQKRNPLYKQLFLAFADPFSAILLVLAIVSLFTDVILADPLDKDPTTVIIISILVLISGTLRFVQESRSGTAAAKLSKMIMTTTCIERESIGKKEILLEDVVVGDIVHLSAGDMIPADLRILSAKDLFISQSALNGESEPVEKYSSEQHYDDLFSHPQLAFMGSNVISGSAVGIVLATGYHTVLGTIAKTLNEKPPKSSFEKGVNSVSWVLIRFMLVMVPIVFFINGWTKGDWMEAGLFAISVAVGLTPEMLPMIVTTGLAKGAVAMSHKKVIVKNMNAIQNLGAMDILCTDKTGTLTQDKVVLEYHLDITGNENTRVLRHAFLNSYYQTGLKNLIDLAIIQFAQENMDASFCKEDYRKIDEIPFDFERRRMSVVIEDKNKKTQMITKGAVEEMLKICAYVEYQGEIQPLNETLKTVIEHIAEGLNQQGLRVIALAQKTNPKPVGEFSIKDEEDMVFMGYLAFLDPPKETTAKAIQALQTYGVLTKILTGDNEKVTKSVCSQVGLKADHVLLGSDIEKMSDSQLSQEVEITTVFAKLSPAQKARIVNILKNNGHVVGYMGDGINDASAMKVSNVGISVDTAVDIAKESADIILLEKDLMVLEEGIIEGRKIYANMIKYIKMTASSNFGNVFSVLIACAFLPFLPMASVQLLLLNLIYNITCIAVPWDHVDEDYLLVPRPWNASSIGRFMVWIGPASSIFDIITFIFMYFLICPMICGGMFHQLKDPAMQALFVSLFQAGWFVESMWSQTLIIHMIRTPKLPFIQSRASKPLTLFTLSGILLLTVIPYTFIGEKIGLSPLPLIYYAGLLFIVIGYVILTTIIKKQYIKKYGELL